MIQHQPPLQPVWAARAAVAHLFVDARSACRVLRWGADWRVLRNPHYLDECAKCVAVSKREPAAKSTRVDSSQACKCGQTIRVTWYELADERGTLVPRCRACARKKRNKAWRARQ